MFLVRILRISTVRSGLRTRGLEQDQQSTAAARSRGGIGIRENRRGLAQPAAHQHFQYRRLIGRPQPLAVNQAYATPALCDGVAQKILSRATRLVAGHAVQVNPASYRPVTTLESAQGALIDTVAGEAVALVDHASDAIGTIGQRCDGGDLRGCHAWQELRRNARPRACRAIGWREWYGVTYGVAKQLAVALAFSFKCASCAGSFRKSPTLVVKLLPQPGQILSKVLERHDFAGDAIARHFQASPLCNSR